MKNSIIDKREDGFSISYASLKDFKKFQELVKGLSKESSCLFTPWLFLENPGNKAKMGQLIAKISLLPMFKTIIKKIFPYGLLVILKVTSDKNQIVGFIYSYNFRKIHSGYSARHAQVIADKFQGQGLGKFQTKCMEYVARKENVRHFITGVFLDNKASLSLLKKDGWKVTQVQKNLLMTCGKRHDVAKLTKDLD